MVKPLAVDVDERCGGRRHRDRASRELANRRRSGGGVLGVVIGVYLHGKASERANTAHYAYILWSFFGHFADYPRRFHG